MRSLKIKLSTKGRAQKRNWPLCKSSRRFKRNWQKSKKKKPNWRWSNKRSTAAPSTEWNHLKVQRRSNQMHSNAVTTKENDQLAANINHLSTSIKVQTRTCERTPRQPYLTHIPRTSQFTPRRRNWNAKEIKSKHCCGRALRVLKDQATRRRSRSSCWVRASTGRCITSVICP